MDSQKAFGGDFTPFDAPAFEVFMLYAAHRYRSAIVKAFVEFVLDEIQTD